MSGAVILQLLSILAACSLCYLYGRLRGEALAYRKARTILVRALDSTDLHRELDHVVEALDTLGA